MNPISYASLDKDGWELEDVVRLRECYEGNVEILTEEERSSVQPGDRVQMTFLLVREEGEDEGDEDDAGDDSDVDDDNDEPDVFAENMWVTVKKVLHKKDGSVYYVGTMDDIPIVSNVLSLGDEIVFGPENISNWWVNPPA